jgi:hypothetical protein
MVLIGNYKRQILNTFKSNIDRNLRLKKFLIERKSFRLIRNLNFIKLKFFAVKILTVKSLNKFKVQKIMFQMNT